jgi:hypothetical protein
MTAAKKPVPAPVAAPVVDPAPAPTVAPSQSAWSLIGHAIAQRIAAPARPRPVKQPSGTSLLDFILVTGALVLIGGGLYGLFTIHGIDSATLPIIASLLSFVSGSILGAYAGYRWGASDTMKKAAATTPTSS